MQRYTAKQRIGNKGWVIWDSILSRFLGDGKGAMLEVSMVEADQVIKIMSQRVGA